MKNLESGKLENNNGKFKIYMFLWAAIFLFSIIYLMLGHGRVLDNLIFHKGSDFFMDFFNHISYIREGGADVYTVNPNACFPPLAYFFYFLLSRILPAEQTVMFKAFSTGPYAILLYVIYTSILIIWLVYAVVKIYEDSSFKHPFLLIMTVVCSNIFIFSVVERGNAAFLVCILLLRAMQLRQEDNPLKREAALILIAIAAGFKIYPALFGLIYIFEKRWKEVLHLVIYGVLLVLVPFVFFHGIDGIKLFIENQGVIQYGSAPESFQSIMGWGRFIAGKWNLGEVNLNVIYVVMILFFALAMIALLSLKENWKKYFLITALMIILPLWSSDYTRFYMLVPLIFFLQEKYDSDKRGEAFVFSVLFAIMFIFWTYVDTSNDFLSKMHELAPCLAIYIGFIIIVIQGVIRGAKAIAKREKDISVS